MSQKTTKRSRRRTEEELDPEFKIPGASKTKEEIPKTSKDEPDCPKNETNGFKGSNNSTVESTNGENDDDNQADSPKRVIQTRSRSNTPLIKTPESAKNDAAAESDEADVVNPDEKNTSVDEEANEVKPEETNGTKAESSITKDEEKNEAKALEETVVVNGGVEEDDSPITLSLSNSPELESALEKEEEEAIPELQFDENDLDLESEGSPSRCKTRRSQTRNVSTPKTPKLTIEQETETKASYAALERIPEDNISGKSTPKKLTSSNDSNIGSESQPDEIVDLDTSDTYSSVSTDNVSTRAVAGSDATRNTDFSYQDSGLFDENSLNSLATPNPNRSYADTLRNLSPRRALHATVNDYRKRALQNSLDIKGDIYADYESVQRIPSGTKRKNRSITPEESKRFKKESSGLLSYISGPISNIKSSFSRSSTPKLVSYEIKKDEFDDDVAKIRIENGNDDDMEKKWCSIM